MAKLDKVVNPACSRCGCPGSTVIERAARWGKEQERRRCDNCRHVFWAPIADPSDNGMGVPFFPLRCPGCKGKHVPTTNTYPDGVRRHKCSDCGKRFKSHEV